MVRRVISLVLLSLALVIAGCSDEGSNVSTDRQVHPADWIATHPAPALATAGFGDCVSCHGANLAGSGGVPSCFSCHAFNTAPPFIVHPATWVDPYFDHRSFAALNGTDTCSGCHGAALTGTAAAPSCFSASFNGLGCHADGPGVVPHALDGSFLNGALHGPIAEQDLTVCQNCHGEGGGPGSNPRFNIGINSVNGTGCEACHGVNYAHPPNWGVDPSGVFHNQAGNIANACTLCHGVALDGVGGVGVSCLGCHGASPADNPTGCLSCHGRPPNGTDPVGNVRPNRVGQHNRIGHTIAISNAPSLTCRRCHFGVGSGTSAHFDGAPPADVVFENPDGTDTVSAVSDGTNTTCTGECHVSGLTWPHSGSTWY